MIERPASLVVVREPTEQPPEDDLPSLEVSSLFPLVPAPFEAVPPSPAVEGCDCMP